VFHSVCDGSDDVINVGWGFMKRRILSMIFPELLYWYRAAGSRFAVFLDVLSLNYFTGTRTGTARRDLAV